jgi:ATP-dependent DNA ligase
MLSGPAPEIPRGAGWLYEPKWDGFRALVFRDGVSVRIISRRQTDLNRYFPELLVTLAAGLPERVVIDGEIIVVGDRGLEFETLQLRLHPAAARVARLSHEIPSSFVAFDILALNERNLLGEPLSARRAILLGAIKPVANLCVTPQTADADEAASWFTRFEGAGLDGVIAKRVDSTYQQGKRTWVKVKHQRTADCVVGGYRVASAGSGVGSLLLGLYDEHGVLHYVGHTSSFSARERKTLAEFLSEYEGDGGFGSGRSPGGPSRWSQGRETAWVGLRPELCCEVAFEKLEGDRFRHSARFLRWRDDKAPSECTYDQLSRPEAFDLAEIVSLENA